jgi:hypothetical protein
MAGKEKELKKAIKMGIKTLILQEVRLSRLERAFTPFVMTDEMSHSIQETKRMIIKLTRSMDHKKRTVLLKRMVCQAVDEEIERAIALRKTKCIRCLHGRFYDEAGTAYVNLPVKTRAVAIGCDQFRPGLRKSCRRFVEMSMAASLGQYLNEMTLLYEFRDLITRMEEVWKDYFLGR